MKYIAMKNIQLVDALSRLALEWMPIYPMNRKDVVFDVFKHHISYKDGLPPYAQARIIDLISNRLLKARQYPALWVSVDAPGVWFLNEIKRLAKRKIPMTIQPAERTSVVEANFYQPVRPTYLQEGDTLVLEPLFDATEYNIKESALRVLRVLARLKAAYRPEIASLTGFSESYVWKLLKRLQVKGWIERKQIGKYEGWQIRTTGLSLMHRSWNIPKGVHFTKYRGEYRYAGERHRRVSRMWRSWLEVAYPSIEIWESWTEVPLFDGIPDALAWGHTGKREILFWLEVDSGHSSRRIMKRNYSRRLKNAYLHAKEWGIPIVFCIMGPPWVVEFFPYCIATYYPNLAMIGQDWREFGKLPMYEFGRWNYGTEKRYKNPSGGILPFDPKQYPGKLKREKKTKLPKLKSTKPKFTKGYDDADRWYRRHSEGEE